MPYKHLSHAIACDVFTPNRLWDMDFDEEEEVVFGVRWAPEWEPDFDLEFEEVA